jgi:hypothetical protein
VAACEHQLRPCHGGARPCSGVTGPPCSVTSSREHQDRKGKARRGLDEKETCYAVLATEDHGGGGAPVNSERGKVSNAAYPELGCSNGVADEVCEVVAEL